MKKEIIKFGDVMSNNSSGCKFVVTDGDIDIVNNNKWNYTFIHSKFRKNVNSYERFNIDSIIDVKSKFLLFFSWKKRGRIMIDPNNGRVAVTTKSPYCLDCNKPDYYLT